MPTRIYSEVAIRDRIAEYIDSQIKLPPGPVGWCATSLLIRSTIDYRIAYDSDAHTTIAICR